MRSITLIAAAFSGFGASAIAAEQPSQPLQPPAGRSTSSELSRSGGVIKPPAEVDPAMPAVESLTPFGFGAYSL